MNREQVLALAQKIVTGERNKKYGKPENSFRRIAAYWSAYLDIHIGAVDVALMMALLKIARAATGHDVEDSLVDLAGYAACAAEVAEEKDGEG